MFVRRIAGAVVDRYFDAARLPVSVVEGAAERVGLSPDRFAPTIAYDAFTGTLREGVGRVIGDEELAGEGRRLRVAAGERARAARLRVQAEEIADEAEEKYAKRHQQARRQEQRVAKETARKREAVEQRTEAREQAEAKAAARKKAAAREARQRKEKELQRKQRDERIEQLQVEEQALAREEEALTAASEQLRLEDAAVKAKSARKRSA